MSSSTPSDPRMLLPDWLRDGDMPLPAAVDPHPVERAVAVEDAPMREFVATVEVVDQAPAALMSAPFSDRLSLDTRLDPGALVSVEDLPTWLGGLDRASAPPLAAATAQVSAPSILPTSVGHSVPIEEPEPYQGADAPDAGVVDVHVNGWYAVAGAIGLLILLIAALRLYLS